MTLVRIAWRNLWRNPRRTFITMFSMSFGLTMMIVFYALMSGMVDQMVRFATILGAGHIQVHHVDYLEERSLYDTMNETKRMLETIAQTGVGHAAPRSFATALISSGPQSTGSVLWGIDPKLEREVTELHLHLEQGSFLDPDPSGGVVLGRNLARKLAVEPGDEIIILTQAADGSMGNALYTVSGILKSVGEALDRGGVLIHRQDLDDLVFMQGRVHEITIRLNDPGNLEMDTETILQSLDPMGVEVKNWKELFPELNEYLRLSDTSTVIVLAIIFAVASLGIMNTQLMALFERTREIGVMRALGLGPGPIALLVLLETMFLTFLSAVVGGAAGSLWSAYLEKYGWDLTNIGGSFSFAGVAFETHFRATLTTSAVVDSVVVMIIISFAATLYPLFRAVRITPADAIGRGR
jgi:ABC-type lipoprotein release transport system permease subunit